MSRADDLRLREIVEILTRPFSDPDLEWMTTEMKLLGMFQPEKYPIIRRKIVRHMPVRGLWWMSESQWVRFLWSGHEGKVIRSDQDPDRVYARKAFDAGGWCYIRDMGDRYDLEAMSHTTKWDLNKTAKQRKRSKKKNVYEWLVCSITKEEYAKLDEFLGPEEMEVCRHKEE